MNNDNFREGAAAGVRSSTKTISKNYKLSKKIAIDAEHSPYPGYSPLAPVKNDLRVSVSGADVQIHGRIFDLQDKILTNPLKIEIWHLSPNSEKYSHRAITYSDEIGRYRFITDLPNREMGHNYKIYLKISNGNQRYFTHLSFNHCTAFISTRESNGRLGHYVDNSKLKDSLLTDRFIFCLDIVLPVS